MKRKKYDYRLIISFFNLEREFNKYCKVHKNISFNRQARSFLVSKGVDYKHDWFLVDHHNYQLSNLVGIVKTPWLDD